MRRSSRQTDGLALLQKTSNVFEARGRSTSSTCRPQCGWSAVMADVTRASKSKNQQPYCFNSITLLRFMHAECFEVWQDNILAFISKLKDGGKRGKQQWSEKQKVILRKNPILVIIFLPKQGNLWKQPGYHLAVEVCGCCCGEVNY